jgi:hypothetical protein
LFFKPLFFAMRVELSQELFAKLILRAVPTESKNRRQAENFVKQRYIQLSGSGAMPILPENELSYIRHYKDQLLLEEQEQAFLERSLNQTQAPQPLRQAKKMGSTWGRIRYWGAIAGLFALASLSLWNILNSNNQATNLRMITHDLDAPPSDAPKNTNTSQPETRAILNIQSETSIRWIHYECQARVLNHKGQALKGAKIEFLGASYQTDALGRVKVLLVAPSTYDEPISIKVQKLGYQALELNLAHQEFSQEQTWVLKP